MRWPYSLLALAVAGLAPVAVHADDVTYNKHVAPILFKHCAGCHRPGEIGPFSLLTYKDAAKRADFIKSITASKRMPPWKAEPGHGEFLDARVLNADELKTLAAWVESGAKEGDPKDLPPPPRFAEGWQLGEPDVVVKMSEAFKVPADGKDLQYCFVVPIPLDADKTVGAVEFRPGNRRVVHHAIMYLDANGQARKKDDAEPGPGYRSFAGPGIIPSGGLGGWAPGATPQFLPEGVGRVLKKGSDLVLQIHYHPDGKEESDQSSVGLYFTKKPAEKILGGVALRSRNLYIPAGQKDYAAGDETKPLPCDVKAIAIFPHMHYVGKEMKVEAKLPDGKTVPLIWIRDWDFNWQGEYQYREPVNLPRGTVIKMTALYDNSSDNPRNPSNPPKLVRWGEQTTDEMCLCGINLITETRADLIKVMGMKNNALAALLGGASLPGALKGMVDPKEVDIPADGVTIPEQFKLLLNRFDKNSDGKLTAEEIDAMPERLKKRVKEYIKNSKASPDVTLPDAKGEKHSRAEWKDKKAVVLFFIAKDCPVSNGYAPEYAHLAKAFGERDVAVYGVQSDPDVTAEVQVKHAMEYGLTFPILMDPKQVLAKMTGAKVTPEAVLLTPEGKVVYRGRIDDRVSEDGKRRDEPRVHDLRDAVDAVLVGKSPPVAETKAYGCPLPSPRKDNDR